MPKVLDFVVFLLEADHSDKKRAGDKGGPLKAIGYGVEWKNATVPEKAEVPNRGK